MPDRYLKILKGEAKPWFRLAQGVPAGLARQELEGAGLDELWRRHDQALGLLRSGRGTAAGAAGPSLVDLKGEIARRILSSCRFCEHRCLVDRTAGETGVCGVPAESRYASEFLHHGEEPELVPSHTIFFTGCTFSCVYCQNWDIATRPLSGRVADPDELAQAVERGWREGSRNVNFVGGNPDSHLHTCIAILRRIGVDIPVVWNSNAYASREAMRLLDGIVDVFLSDFRYGNDGCARRYSGIDGYMEVVTRNFLLAQAQAEVMLRHLVLPGHLECCTRPIMAWVARNLPGVYFNLMFQYRPSYRSLEYPGLDRALSAGERQRALALAAGYGITPSC